MSGHHERRLEQPRTGDPSRYGECRCRVRTSGLERLHQRLDRLVPDPQQALLGGVPDHADRIAQHVDQLRDRPSVRIVSGPLGRLRPHQGVGVGDQAEHDRRVTAESREKPRSGQSLPPAGVAAEGDRVVDELALARQLAQVPTLTAAEGRPERGEELYLDAPGHVPDERHDRSQLGARHERVEEDRPHFSDQSSCALLESPGHDSVDPEPQKEDGQDDYLDPEDPREYRGGKHLAVQCPSDPVHQNR